MFPNTLVPEDVRLDIISRAEAVKSRGALQKLCTEVQALPSCPAKKLLMRYLVEVGNDHGWYGALAGVKPVAQLIPATKGVGA